VKSNVYAITLGSDISSLIEDALEIAGKVEFTKENPTMEIKIKGKLILHFDYTITEYRILELEISD